MMDVSWCVLNLLFMPAIEFLRRWMFLCTYFAAVVGTHVLVGKGTHHHMPLIAASGAETLLGTI